MIGPDIDFKKIFLKLKTCYKTEISFLNYNNAFQLLIAVILSAQTTDNQVNKITPVLFEKYPDAEHLDKADIHNEC